MRRLVAGAPARLSARQNPAQTQRSQGFRRIRRHPEHVSSLIDYGKIQWAGRVVLTAAPALPQDIEDRDMSGSEAGMTFEKFEPKVTRLLRQHFAGPNDPNLANRRQQLRDTFDSVPDAATAKALHGRLSVRNDGDTLSKEFHDRIATATRDELLQILSRKSQHASPVTAGQKTERQFRLVDEEHSNERAIALTDPKFLNGYIDKNIVHVTTDPDPHTLEHHTMVIHYKDGRQLELRLNSVPVKRAPLPGTRTVRVQFSVPLADHYVLREGVIIPVDRNGVAIFNDTDTPNVIAFRTTIERNIILRRQRVEIAELTNAFGGVGGVLTRLLQGMSVVLSLRDGFIVRPRLGRPKPLSSGGKPPDSPYVVSKQYKQVTALEMLAWENEGGQNKGGHTLRHHNWQLTRKILFQRIDGKEPEIPAPQMQKGGKLSPEFRVWEGKHVPAASAWVDKATMEKAIGDVIHKHIGEIRADAMHGKPWRLEQAPVGYKTGHGWVGMGAATKAERGVWWRDNLTGITIIIRPRQGHIPTDTDPERWYVHTAYPDVAK
jgi:hypothetical protein